MSVDWEAEREKDNVASSSVDGSIDGALFVRVEESPSGDLKWCQKRKVTAYGQAAGNPLRFQNLELWGRSPDGKDLVMFLNKGDAPDDWTAKGPYAFRMDILVRPLQQPRKLIDACAHLLEDARGRGRFDIVVGGMAHYKVMTDTISRRAPFRKLPVAGRVPVSITRLDRAEEAKFLTTAREARLVAEA